MKSVSLAVVLLLAAPWPALAATVSCPALDDAVRVGNCPAEAELAQAFNDQCAAKSTETEGDLCGDYGRFRQSKNVARWEAADGKFTATLSCELPTLGVRQAKASAIAVVKQGKQTQIVCGYAERFNFAYRTRAQCELKQGGDCATDPAACKASCK